MRIKALIRNGFNRLGYDIRRTSDELGQDSLLDMRKLTLAGERPVIFDAGANVGWSTVGFRATFARPTVHAFEPSPATFAELRGRAGGFPDTVLNNVALGAAPGTAEFHEHDENYMNSLLEAGADNWVKSKNRTRVEIKTIDGYCSEHAISHIDILKSDTQGYDLEVLKGAAGMLDKGAVHLVYVELTFCELYKGMPRPDIVMAFLLDRGMDLVSMYHFDYQDRRARWVDALFINRAFKGPAEAANTGRKGLPSSI